MITEMILGGAVLLLLTGNLILISALVARVRVVTPQSRSLPVVMLGSTIQSLVAVAPESDVRRAIAYWADHGDLVHEMARQFRDQQAAQAGKIIDDSGQDLQSFIKSLPQAASGRESYPHALDAPAVSTE